MKSMGLAGLAWVAGFGVALAAPAAPESTVAAKIEPAGPSPVAAAELIRQMGDDSFRVREEATKALWSLGEDAVPVLREALRHPDPEIAFRARKLADQIDLGILPDTPQQVRDLVEKYRGTDGRQKLPVVFELQRLKAWRPILKLFALEKDEELREALREAIDGVAVRAAREELVAGREASARMFLEMAPADSEGLMALAALHAARGTVAEELAKAKELEGERGAKWRLALHRAAGDLKSAAREARAAGEGQIAAAMELLQGDPRAWLERESTAGNRTFFHEQYAKFAARQWRAGLPDEAAVQAISRALEDADDEERWFGISALFLTGRADEGARALEKMNKVVAFSHYDSLERTDDAMRMMGVDPEKPDFVAWAKKRAAKMLGDLDEGEEQGEELLLMAAFLERRGLVDEAREWLNPFLDQLMDKDAEVFTDKLAEMFAYNMTILPVEAAGRFAGDDPARWAAVFAAALGDDAETGHWWTLLATLDPDAAPMRRFEALLSLFGTLPGPDAEKTRASVLEKVWEMADKAGEVEKKRLLGLLAHAGIKGGDLDTSLRALRPLAGGDTEHEKFGYYLLLLSAAGEWKEAADSWRALVKRSPERPDLHAYLASVLRRLGREQEAEKEDRLATLLALGEGSTSVRVGQGYAYGGDFARATAWWRRVLVESQPGDGPWDSALQLYNDSLLEARDWRLAGAIGEAVALSQMEGGNAYDVPVKKMRVRLHANMARALARLGEDRANSVKVLRSCHAFMPVDGSLADHFLPALRAAGLRKEHDEWFETAWQGLAKSIDRYPKCDNTRNTAAWIASRAVRRLDEAEAHLQLALAAKPRQAAYLDTMAELWFARRDRRKALEWSAKAIASEATDDMLRRQHERFRAAPFPEK